MSSQGMPVTKVRFLPRTGRRHQLRVHSLCLGHPIVGDFTYNPVHREAVLAANALRADVTSGGATGTGAGGETEESNSGVLAEMDAKIADRMMLHAHRLR